MGKTKNADLLYRQVKQTVLGLIQKGELGPGDRAPSLRSMSLTRKVSLSTVLQAYMELEDDGVLESRPKSGFFVKATSSAQIPLPSPATQVSKPVLGQKNDFILQVLEACTSPDLLQIGSSLVDPSLLPVTALQRSYQRVLKEHPELTYAYAPSEGLPELRRMLALRGLAAGSDFDETRTIVTVGGSEALTVALRALTRPGDMVAIETPTYYGFIHMLEILGLRAVEIPTCMGEGVEMDDLRRALDRYPIRACLFSPNFNNPIGSLYPDEKKEAVVKLLEQKGVPLIEDDIYGDLHFTPKRPLAAKHFDRKGNVLYCSSFSKTLSPGLRVGWLEAGSRFETALKIKASSSLANPGLPQMAVVDFLRTGHYDRHLRHVRGELTNLAARYRGLIGQYFPVGTKVTQPMGGTVLWVELPGKADGDKIFRRARDEGMNVVPGSIFNSQSRFQNCIRINFARPLTPKIDQALRRLGEIAARP